MSLPHYLPTNDAQRGVTYSMLTFNFRSHPAILELPNRLFYNKELLPHASPSTINALASWNGWPQKSFPILFHAVRGRDEREGTSPSFFNVAEISAVKMYVNQLQYAPSGVKLRDEDIGPFLSSSALPSPPSPPLSLGFLSTTTSADCPVLHVH